MTEHVRVRRCAVLMIEPREQLELDLAGLLAGDDALASLMSCIALAPHLDAEVTIDANELLALMRIGETPWLARARIDAIISSNLTGRLLDKGLLIGDGETHAALRERDEAVRESHWRPLSAVAHYFSRWSDTGVDEDARITRHRSIADLVSEYGLPPPHLVARVPPERRIALPSPHLSELEAIFRRRVTCRNFDTSTLLGSGDLGAMLHRVFGCHAIVDVIPGACGLKKSYPSGGGLHPLEAYLLLRRVDGIETGLYHYHAGDHTLEPLTQLAEEEAQRLARCFVAGQGFFADAPVHIALVARFGRTFWKYRNHPKAYRAIVLEAGHASQNLYLCATEAGMGAYVTAAINEIDIERAFGLDSLRESAIAVCGFGARAAAKETMELDPLGAVWNEDGRRR
ncbi:MAG: putative peptide maturation dehydrogenase [Dokdonella sp.]